MFGFTISITGAASILVSTPCIVLFARKLRRQGVQAVLCNTFRPPAESNCLPLAASPCDLRPRIHSQPPPSREDFAQADMVLAVPRMCEYLKDMAPPERIAVAYDHLDTAPLTERVRVHRESGKRLLPSHRAIGGWLYWSHHHLQAARPVPGAPSQRFCKTSRKLGSQSWCCGAARTRLRGRTEGLAGDLGIADYVAFMVSERTPWRFYPSCRALRDLRRDPFHGQSGGPGGRLPVVASDTGGCREMMRMA